MNSLPRDLESDVCVGALSPPCVAAPSSTLPWCLPVLEAIKL